MRVSSPSSLVVFEGDQGSWQGGDGSGGPPRYLGVSNPCVFPSPKMAQAYDCTAACRLRPTIQLSENSWPDHPWNGGRLQAWVLHGCVRCGGRIGWRQALAGLLEADDMAWNRAARTGRQNRERISGPKQTDGGCFPTPMPLRCTVEHYRENRTSLQKTAKE